GGGEVPVPKPAPAGSWEPETGPRPWELKTPAGTPLVWPSRTRRSGVSLTGQPATGAPFATARRTRPSALNSTRAPATGAGKVATGRLVTRDHSSSCRPPLASSRPFGETATEVTFPARTTHRSGPGSAQATNPCSP